MAKEVESLSFDFAVKAVKFSKVLKNDYKEFEIASQFLRSATSVGANICEAKYGQSRADFISKMSIARKEANETKYWLRLLVASDIVSEATVKNLLKEITEIIIVLTAIIKNTATTPNNKS